MQNVSKQRKNAAQLKLQASKKEAPKRAPRKINAGKQAPTKLNASLDSFKKYASSTQEKKFDNGTGDVFTGTILKFPKKYLDALKKRFKADDIVGLVWDEDNTIAWGLDKDGQVDDRVEINSSDFEDLVTEEGLDSSRKSRSGYGCKQLNAAKQVEGEWFYSLGDVETVVAAVLEELDKDNGAAITLEASETGIMLNVTSSEGEEFTVPVDLGIEGDEAPEGDVPVDDMPVEDEYVEEEEYVEE